MLAIELAPMLSTIGNQIVESTAPSDLRQARPSKDARIRLPSNKPPRELAVAGVTHEPLVTD